MWWTRIGAAENGLRRWMGLFTLVLLAATPASAQQGGSENRTTGPAPPARFNDRPAIAPASDEGQRPSSASGFPRDSR